MAPPARQRPTAPSSPDDQSSTVRERSNPSAAPAPSSPAPSSPAPSNPGSSGAPRERLEGKLKTARLILSELSAADDRARLLHVAIMRRDEALLDGVLAALGVGRPASLPPPR